MKLTSMKLKKRDKNKNVVMASTIEGDQYPYGLRITLENEQLEKLGIKELPETGEYITLEAECCVTSTSENKDSSGNARRSVALQIEKLGCENEGEDEDESAVDAVDRGVKKANAETY